ncbi:galactokinase [Nocardioides terrae]|uniref:Galactokinase n=1 Tax=Nocardioides terrae TaxID=574651 RepID=A0A1I1IEH9_9ACTN|nr:galactokinase [Nocardioides terrae]SFC34545.1 galactokinase [Nocardioides terrae]
MTLPTSHASAEHAVDGFRQTFGREPDGVWSAPGRVNLIGEHTDYNDGFVLPVAIEQRTWVAVGRRADRVARVASAAADDVVERPVDAISPTSVSGWSAYPLGTAWAVEEVAAEDSVDVCGFDAYFASDVPLGAGLSSSAALECSLARALSDLWRLDLDGEELLRATHLAENVIVGAPTGILDQSASLFSREGHALFIDCRSTSMEPIPFDPAGAGLSLLVIDTRVTHAHADGGYAARRASCEQAASALGVAALRDATPAALEAARDRLDEVVHRRARHIVAENQRVLDTVALLRTEGPRAIGRLLLESHASMRDDFEISVPELDTAVEVAVGSGALGARMTGGGFGGSAIALVEDGLVADVVAAVTDAFAARGYAPPVTFTVRPSQGARRDEGVPAAR